MKKNHSRQQSQINFYKHSSRFWKYWYKYLNLSCYWIFFVCGTYQIALNALFFCLFFFFFVCSLLINILMFTWLMVSSWRQVDNPLFFVFFFPSCKIVLNFFLNICIQILSAWKSNQNNWIIEQKQTKPKKKDKKEQKTEKRNNFFFFNCY